jgi:hypothetical protein
LPASDQLTGSRQFDGAWAITIDPKGCNSYVTGRARVFSPQFPSYETRGDHGDGRGYFRRNSVGFGVSFGGGPMDGI